ncbi:MAG: glutamine--fructose-6-phosphate transaminase (isomerizing) [Patescibacteria group bacterium]|nr:glutamine--fructose-6-phosphate transaminase (isomerizing) [Patescibacteria group bacterium]
MCGIVGYIGKQKALPILLDGIKTLEYRGYDSTGVAVLNNKINAPKIYYAKSAGRINVLEEKIAHQKNGIDGFAGIAHTRWATHGEPNEVNAHPHFDCKKQIFLAHNGIIENYKELKANLIKKGHKFSSETDTEVLVHMLEDERNENPGFLLEEAALKVLKKIKGTYGLVIIDAREPEKLVAVRNFSPLVLGIGDGEYIVASDASALLKYTRQIVFLHDGEIAVLTPEKHKIFNLRSESVTREPEKIEWTEEIAKKGDFPHFMLKEIFEQPEAIENSLRGRLLSKEGLVKLGGLESVQDKLREAERIIIAACGTAYLAGRVGEYIFEEYAGIPTEVDFASEFRYRKPVFRKNDILLVISQSGETADTLAALREAKQKNILTIGIVNVVGSSIARETDAGVYQHIGPEISVASTKAFTSALSILTLFSVFLGRQRGMSLTMGRRITEELGKIPDLIKQILKSKDQIFEIAKKYESYNNFLYLGRKYNMPIAQEGALKLKEISYVHAEGYGAGEMKHGPIAMINKEFPSVVIAPSDSVYEKMISNIEEVKARRGPIIAIATEGNKEIKQIVEEVIYIPKTLEMLTPILSVVPLQLFAYFVGVLRGVDIDQPKNLAKSVTVE